MFGRLKLALVALVLMPAAAFAADRAPQHAPGAPDTLAVIAKVAVTAADSGEGSRKHHSSAKTEDTAPSTMSAFLDRLRDEPAPAVASSGAKQAAASVTSGESPVRTPKHQPG